MRDRGFHEGVDDLKSSPIPNLVQRFPILLNVSLSVDLNKEQHEDLVALRQSARNLGKAKEDLLKVKVQKI